MEKQRQANQCGDDDRLFRWYWRTSSRMNLNSSNRLVRTRMLGGVAGEQSHRLPPMPMPVRFVARVAGAKCFLMALCKKFNSTARVSGYHVAHARQPATPHRPHSSRFPNRTAFALAWGRYQRLFGAIAARRSARHPVSYTHLTLPTTSRV